MSSPYNEIKFLSIREYVATAAMQGILSNPSPGMQSKYAKSGTKVTPESVAYVALEYANALVAALEATYGKQD